MSTDFDRALVAKGIKVSGPFGALNDMTYSDKRAADLALTPIVYINVTSKEEPERMIGSQGVVDYVEKVVTLKVDAFVAFEMKEPLSGEKLWVKKLDLPPSELTTVLAYGVDVVQVVNQYGGFSSDYRNNNKLLYDGRQDTIAKLAEGWYPEIMNKAWTYLDTTEMLELKKQVEEIRKKATVIQN
jgi:hypothetical protein